MWTKTTLAQSLPADMEDKVVTFHQFMVRAQRRCEYPLSHIINMDETPMGFELPATWTLEFTGSRTVPITTCSAEKRSFTVALAVKANGEKLTPKIIFKGVLQLRVYGKYCRKCKSQCTRKAGWMDEEGIYHFACLFSFCSVMYQITEHMHPSTYHIFDRRGVCLHLIAIWSFQHLCLGLPLIINSLKYFSLFFLL